MTAATAAWLGVVTTLWVAQTLALAYVLYRYVWIPWKVVRRDLATLGARVTETRAYAESVVNLKRLDAMSDEEIAFREERLRSRSRARTGT